jgi:hypothetical protein
MFGLCVQGLCMVLDAVCVDGDLTLEPYLDNLFNNLFAQVTQLSLSLQPPAFNGHLSYVASLLLVTVSLRAVLTLRPPIFYSPLISSSLVWSLKTDLTVNQTKSNIFRGWSVNTKFKSFVIHIFCWFVVSARGDYIISVKWSAFIFCLHFHALKK